MSAKGSPEGSSPLAGVSGGVPLKPKDTARVGGWEEKRPCFPMRQALRGPWPHRFAGNSDFISSVLFDIQRRVSDLTLILNFLNSRQGYAGTISASTHKKEQGQIPGESSLVKNGGGGGS